MPSHSYSINCEEAVAGRVHPRKFKQHLSGHECVTVPEAGLAGKSNGELLAFAEKAKYDVFLTLDLAIPYQQNLARRNIAVVLIHAQSIRLEHLLPLASLSASPAGPRSSLPQWRRSR